MKRIILLLVALAVAAVACSPGTKSEFEANRDKWQRANIDHYRYALRVICFCPSTDRMPLSVEVQNGEVVALMYADGTPVTADDPQYQFFSRFTTIDSLFADLKTNLDGAADEVVVTYDPTYGYPVQVNIDMIKEAIDDELALTVSDFERLE